MAETKYRYPKRRIERVSNRINHQLTNAATTSILHTCEDRKTLVRAIITLYTFRITGVQTAWNYVLHRLPRGQSVGSPSVSESLDNDVVKEQIWDISQGQFGTALEVIETHVDLKSMRKMDPGDTLVLKDTCSVAAGAHVYGQITLFFKE